MNDLESELSRQIARLASDRESGATAILEEVIRILGVARDAGLAVAPLARAICRAQPTMASIWNAAIEAAASRSEPERFHRFVQRVARSQAAVARFGLELFAPHETNEPLRLLTLSASRSVRTVFEAVRSRRPIHVSCSESGPAREGRTLAATLAEAGIPVTVFGDSAIGHALASCDAVLVGADAIAADSFVNKSGTRMLAAAAAQQGVAVYVAAARDKFLRPEVASRLVIREGAPGEVWESPPAGVEVRNPYFEYVPLDLVTGVISDAGVLGAGMVADVCAVAGDRGAAEAIAELTRD
jgi:translation initiation factor 2B subunit (eIF-2B alpha/beta/delta family)